MWPHWPPLSRGQRRTLAQVFGGGSDSAWCCHAGQMVTEASSSPWGVVLPCPTTPRAGGTCWPIAGTFSGLCYGASALWMSTVLSEVRELGKLNPKPLRWGKTSEQSVCSVPDPCWELVQWDPAGLELFFEFPPCVRHRPRPRCRGLAHLYLLINVPGKAKP